MNIVFSDATSATAVQTYSEMLIVGADGHRVETVSPRGVAVATPVTNVNIDGISQFSGLTNGTKVLTISGTGTSAVWDSGEATTIATSTEYTLYDADDNNFILVTIGAAPPSDGDYNVVIQDGCLANAITVLQLGDELLSFSPVITDANGSSCISAGTYPRPTSAHNYAIYSTDKSLIAVKNPAGTTDISVDSSIYNLPRSYSSLAAVEEDHKADTGISEAAAKMFANGAGHVSVINTYNGASPDNYATCLTTLQTVGYDYDIMVTTVDVEDANFVLCSDHAITYTKIIIAPKIGTVNAVRAAMATLTRSEVQYGICYDDATYTVAELSGVAAAVIAQRSPWIPCEWGKAYSINVSGYSKDDILELEGTATSLRVNTIIRVGSATVLSSGRSLAAGTFLDVPRTKQYLKDLVHDGWVSAKLTINNSNQKVPYTTEGLAIVESVIRDALKRAQKQGAVRADGYNSDGEETYGFVIGMPLIDDIPLSYKAARQLPDVTITACLSGAVETIDPVSFTISLGEA